MPHNHKVLFDIHRTLPDPTFASSVQGHESERVVLEFCLSRVTKHVRGDQISV